MPIGGFVIEIDPAARDTALASFAAIPQLEIHGSNEQGQVVAVIETPDVKEMDTIVSTINKNEYVFNVGLTYINAEDEVNP